MASTPQGGSCAYVSTGVTHGNTSFTDTVNGFFKSTDVGANITIKGAGTAGADLVTTITGFTSNTSVTLGAAASTSASNVQYIYGAAGGTISSNWTTTISVALATGQQPGDGICVAANDDPAHADPTVGDAAGNVFTKRGTTQGNADYHQQIWTAPVSVTMAGGTNKVTVTFASLESGFAEMGWRHFVGASQFGQVAQGNSTGTALTTGNFANTVGSGSAIWFFTGVNSNITAVGAGYNASAITAFSDVEAYQVVATSGTFAATATQGSSGIFLISAVTMVPGPSAANFPINQRAPGFPTYAPLPGIARLGVGILSGANPSSTHAYTGNISESITGPSDAVARAFVGARAISESITGPSDAVAIQQVLARGISESITAPTDAVAGAIVRGPTQPLATQQRTPGFPLAAPLPGIALLGVGLLVATHIPNVFGNISESITAPSDSVAIHQVLARSISESVTGPSDSVSRAFVGARAISESVTAPTDAVARAFVGSRSVAESITAPSDSVTRATVESRGISDSITAPSDSVARALVGARSLAESITAPSDALTRAQVLARAISESITAPSDAVSIAQVLARSISESITAPSDSVSGFLQHGAPSVWLAVQQRAKGFPPTAPMPGISMLGVGLLQAAPTVHVYAKSISESISAPSDSVVIAQVLSRSVSDSITAPSDAVARATVEARALTESVTAPSDSVSRAFVGFRSVAESITAPTDAISRAAGKLRAIAESIGAPTDALTIAQVLSRGIAESVATPSDFVVATLFHQTTPSVWIGLTQRRAVGFPPGAPLPGIAMLGVGVLATGVSGALVVAIVSILMPTTHPVDCTMDTTSPIG